MSDEQTAMEQLKNASANDLAAAMLGHVFDILTSGDAELFKDRRHFFTWVSPGLPFKPEEWDFMTAPIGPSDSESSDGESSGDDAANEAVRRSQGAFTFAQLVDFVPDITGLTDGTTLFDAKAGSLSGEYARVLREAEVVHTPPDKEAQQRIDDIYNTLWTVEEIEVGDQVEKNIRPSHILEEYNQTRDAYEQAVREEQQLHIEADAGVSAEAVRKRERLGSLFRERRLSALQTWESRGRRDLVENLMAEMARLEGEQMVAVVERLQGLIDPTVLPTGPGNQPYFYAQVVPATAIHADWQQFRFTHDEYAYQRERSERSGGGFLSVANVGGFASGSGDWKDMEAQWDWSDFELTFELIELPIVRPWLDESFLTNDRWRFPEGAEPLSDGEEPPGGSMPAIPERVVLAKNVKLHFRDANRVLKRAEDEHGGKAGLALGPIVLGGKAKRATSSVESERSVEEETITSPDTQIVGFRCRLLPRTPDPDPDVPDDNWIGPGQSGGEG